MELQEKIQELLSHKWRNFNDTFNSKQYELLRVVYLQLFKEELQMNCANCLINALTRIKDEHQEILTKTKIMSEKKTEKKYQLHDAKLISYKQSHYSNANLTDEKAEEILKDHPKLIKLFKKFPSVKQPVNETPVSETPVTETPVVETKTSPATDSKESAKKGRKPKA